MTEFIKSQERVYGPLHEMVHLHCETPGFDLRDEYAALWELKQRDLTELEIHKFFLERMSANLLTYAIEKDAADYERTYVLIPDGNTGWKLTTEDHKEFACLTEMAASAVEKAKDEQRDWDYDAAVYQGVVALKHHLLEAAVGTHIGLIYPPIPGSDQSMLYTYTKENEKIRVEGSAVPLNLKGGSRLYSYLHKSTETDLSTNYLVSTPFVSEAAHKEMVRKALHLCFNREFSTDTDLSNKFSLDDFAAGYYEQIEEAAEFLTECIQQEYDGDALTQAGLERLELAFSFARRAILVARKHKNEADTNDQIISAADLRAAYWDKLYMDSRGYISQSEADDYNERMGIMFGSINYVMEEAAGCPAAGLAGLGVQSAGNQLRGVSIHEQGTCPEIQCRRCKNKDISETDTECRKCGWKPGDPIEAPKKSISPDHTTAHYQTQVRNENLKEIKLTKKEKVKKKNTSLWAVLFGLSV